MLLTSTRNSSQIFGKSLEKSYADDELDKRWEVQDGRHSFATRQRPTMGRRSLKFSDKELTKQVHKGINLSSNHTLTQPVSPRR
jgi:hypothetical protein